MRIPRIPCFFAAFVLLTICSARPQSQTNPTDALAISPIRFNYQPIDFKLDSDETPERHAPETMAGGVAVFDYNNDGKLDIFFASSKARAMDTSPMSRRRRASPEPATTQGSQSAITTTTAAKIFSLRACITALSTTTTATELLPMSPRKLG
jgi:hypothetical protein